MIPDPPSPGTTSPLTPAPGIGPDRMLPPLAPGTYAPPAPDDSHFAPTPDMGGPLVVTPPGGTSVATDGMQAAIERAADVSDDFARALRAVRRAELVPNAPSLVHLEQALQAGAGAVHRLGEGLREAVGRYTAADGIAAAAFDGMAGVEGAMIGTGVRAAAGIGLLGLLSGSPAVVGGLVGLLAGGRAVAHSGALGRFLVDHPQLTSNPRFVSFVRGIADGMDEGLTTAAGVPIPIAIALGATGRTNVSTSAGALMAVGPKVGLLEESPVTVQRVDVQSVAAPPDGSAARLARVPEGDDVRIEKYSAPGRADRYVVYVSPTATFDPQPEGKPWDLASNVGGVGGEDVGAIRATELAMRDAGIGSDSQVQLVGFSQGGMVATRVAADGNWNAVGLQTFGAPAGNVALPDGIQGMAVRNAEDFVPALAGPQTDHHLLQVQRTVYADPSQMPTDQAAPGHQKVAYAATAEAIDAARSGEVRSQSTALDAFTADYAGQSGSSITAYTYHASRDDGTGGRG